MTEIFLFCWMNKVCEHITSLCIGQTRVRHIFYRIMHPLAMNIFYAFEMQITPIGNKMVQIN